MGESAARQRLRKEREKAKAERGVAERKPVTSQEAYEGNGSNEELLDILTSHGIVTDPDEMRAHALWVALINWRNASSKDVADMYRRAKAELAVVAARAETAEAELARVRSGCTPAVVWVSYDDDEGFGGVWRTPEHAQRQIIAAYAAATPGDYRWSGDADGTHDRLLRDDEPTAMTLWPAVVNEEGGADA